MRKEKSFINQVNQSLAMKSYIQIPSLIKWTGSKRSLANQISLLAPKHNRYIEPFLGGGAVLYCLAKPGSIASDVYEPLMKIWQLVQEEPEKIIEDYKKKWQLLQKYFPNYFYEIRNRFNSYQNGQDLLFLSRTCTNGIIRFNSKGEFNNSLHVTRKGMHPDNFEKIVKKWNVKLDKIKLVAIDYREIIDSAKEGDFLYLDPPYSGSNNRYIQNLDVDIFFQNLEKLNSKGAKWALSFDGWRGSYSYINAIPCELYKQRIFLKSGNSAVKKVLNSSVEEVTESLILNYRP